jgi:3',5'-cyclic AMP phosphodiesterase CpdA
VYDPVVMALSRRSFVLAGLAPVAAAASRVSFGVIADVHHGLMPDAHDRLRAFLAAARDRRPDFLIQLGDFCHSAAQAQEFLRTWREAPGTRYSVLGNHDMDHGSKRQIMDGLGMAHSYYSFDAGGFHWIVLDCNHLYRDGRFSDFEKGNYFIDSRQRDWVNADQAEWLEYDLAATALPAIVFSHQPVESPWDRESPPQRRKVREVIAASRARGRGRVVAAFAGHDHVDTHRRSGGVDYFFVNSASYFWAGEKYGGMAKYRDPVFAFVTIGNGTVVIEGRQSEFVPPTPGQMNHPEAARATAGIENRRIAL